MDLNNLTKEVDTFIQTHGGYWDPPWLLAAITEELGELSRALQIHSRIRQGESLDQEKTMSTLIEEECGDIFFALICLTNSYDINLEKALLSTLSKYNSR